MARTNRLDLLILLRDRLLQLRDSLRSDVADDLFLLRSGITPYRGWRTTGTLGEILANVAPLRDDAAWIVPEIQARARARLADAFLALGKPESGYRDFLVESALLAVLDPPLQRFEARCQGWRVLPLWPDDVARVFRLGAALQRERFRLESWLRECVHGLQGGDGLPSSFGARSLLRPELEALGIDAGQASRLVDFALRQTQGELRQRALGGEPVPAGLLVPHGFRHLRHVLLTVTENDLAGVPQG
ncbi:MAG: hypothetical protein AAF682_13380 [Planctomycetota bacterium]